MWRILAAIFALNFIMLLTDGVYEGGGGIQATQLDGDITDVAITITVDSTAGFAPTNNTITIGAEDMFYTHLDATHFYLTNVSNRGTNGTDAEAHEDDDMVYNRGAGLVNEMGNYAVTTTGTGGGASATTTASVVSVGAGTWTRSLSKMFFWDYGFFSGDLVIIRYFLMGICGILTVIIALNMLPFVNFG